MLNTLNSTHPENEDRRGYSVVLASDEPIRKATSDDSQKI